MSLLLRKARRPRFVTRPSPVTEWQALHRTADALLPRFTASAVERAAQAQRLVSEDVLRAAIMRQDAEAVALELRRAWHASEAAWRERLSELTRELMARSARAIQPFLARIIGRGRRVLKASLDIEITFDTEHPRLSRWIEIHLGRLVREIDAGTHDAIRRIIREWLETPLPAHTVLDFLSHGLGLTASQWGPLLRFHDGLIESGFSARQVRSLMRQRLEAAIRQRALTIARTETITAASRGQLEQWMQAAEQGLLEPDLTRRTWIVTPDEALCAICATIPGANAGGVGFMQPFQTPVGPLMTPVAHPNCRCAVGLVILPEAA